MVYVIELLSFKPNTWLQYIVMLNNVHILYVFNMIWHVNMEYEINLVISYESWYFTQCYITKKRKGF
jgi:hypothetical protein